MNRQSKLVSTCMRVVHGRISIFLIISSLGFSISSTAQASNFTACLVNALFFLTGKAPLKSDDLVWGDSRLSEAQLENLRKFSAKTSRPLRPGYRVEVLSAEEVANQKGPLEIVGANSASDELLLAKSNVETGPREVMRFRLHLDNGSVIDPNVEIFGNGRKLDFSEGEAQLFSALRGKAFGIREIEIVHTHPFHSVRITNTNGQRYFRSVNLSSQDLQVAAEYARRFPSGKRVTIKAVTPSGVNFSASFPTGR